MKLVKSLLTLIAVIILGVLVYFFVYKTEEERKVKEREERQLVRFDLDRINRFTLARPDSSIVFERGIGRLWNIIEPIQTEADGKPLYTLFNSLNQSNILIEVEKKPKDLVPYGLAKPSYYMAMQYDAAEPDTLYLGNDTPDGTMSYVRYASEDRVLAVTNQLTDILKKPVIQYRARTLLNVLADDIIGFEILRTIDEKDDRIQMAYNDVTWMMQYPWELPGDIANIEELTKKLAESNKKTLEEEQTSDLVKYGLDKPSIVLNVSLKYGMPPKMLLIGKRIEEKGKKHLWYAKQFDNNLIFTIENSVVTLLNRTKTWFIEKQPMRFNRNIIDKIVLETGGSKTTFMKDAEDNWSVVSPIDKNVERETINSIFAISRFLLINDIMTLEPTQEDYVKSGIDNPTSIITFYQDDRIIVEARYGKTFMTDKSNTYVATSLSPIIYITNSTINASINDVLNSVFGTQ
ncbi:MAG: DUF4340 domain-containing protein [Candidatus Latescibacteria bacterium]|nr:DUF4340 domain-containing protein [Candidatus Latescibacterota bacterium]